MPWPWNPPVPERNDYSDTPLPRSWPRRHWKALTAVAAVAVLAVGGVVLVTLHPRPPCGDGLSYQSPVCVGLDLKFSGFQSKDPLRALETEIANDNEKVAKSAGSHFITIVYLDDMAPNQTSGDVVPADLKYRLEGAIAGERQVNDKGNTLAGPTSPKIKLLLASYGTNGNNWQQAVNGIIQNQRTQHIAAVTGIGQSLKKTRLAVAYLSDHGITTVGSIASADDMNKNPANNSPIPNFFRVTSTNQDEANAAASWVSSEKYKSVVLVRDGNSDDDYTYNLGTDVQTTFENKHIAVTPIFFNSPGDLSSDRSAFMVDRFSYIRSEVCNDKPSLIYFAGRGVDLQSFLISLAGSGPCPDYQPRQVDVLSGDDADAAKKSMIKEWDNTKFNVYYTAVAAEGEWPKNSGADAENYSNFAQAFSRYGFSVSDLTSGHAIMTYDAVLTATKAAREDSDTESNPTGFDRSSIRGSFASFDCVEPVNGAGGRIAFPQPDAKDAAILGDPIDKAVPIMRLGQADPVALLWSDGAPFDQAVCARHSG